jgi:FtsP/CotA-like multicopper oxidase with cupredoxin domain
MASWLSMEETMITRRRFVQNGLVMGAGLAMFPRLGASRVLAAQSQVPLAGSSIPQFVDPLPVLSVAGGPIETIVAGNSEIVLTMREFQARMMPSIFVPATGTYDGTWVWGYRAGITPTKPAGTYIGPVIVVTRNVPTEIKWVNALGNTADSKVLAWINSTDQTIHWADPLNGEANQCAENVEPDKPPVGKCSEHYAGPVPAVAHLHGGEVPPVLDGGPDSWFTSDGQYHGHAYYTKAGAAGNEAIYRYPNVQETAPIWFHDHTLGLTRLSVYAGLAGGYLIIDPANPAPANLPLPIPLVIQDRMFDTEGQLYFPAGPPFIPNPVHPFWVPEFIGDTIAVNGKVWPFFEVEPRRYRFLCLNGSNARGYKMFLVNRDTHVQGPALWQIGTDGGYLDAPVKIDPNAGQGQTQHLVILPGERADVIIDFAGHAPGTRLLLRNIAKAPYPGGEAPRGNTTGRIMEFRVVPLTSPDTSYNPAAGTPLRSPMVRLANPISGTVASGVTVQKTRQLTLNEVIGEPTTVNGVSYPGGPLEILVNNTELPGTPRPDFTPITVGGITTYYSELPQEGDTEVWEVVNLTADAHPIHLHLVQFQLMNRQAFNVRKYERAYSAAFPKGTYEPGFGPPLDYNTGNPRALGGNPDITPYLQGPVKPPEPNEAGWKDTIQMFPDEVTRIVVRWAPTDLPANKDPSEAFYPFDPDGGQGYVWHCHIIDHEDNEMMRPTSVKANKNATRTYVRGTDY